MYVVRLRNKCSRYFHSPQIPWYRASGKLHIMCIFLSLSRIHVQTGTWERGLQTCERCLGTYERGKRSLWILIFVPNRCSNSALRVGSNSATREKQQAHKARPKNYRNSRGKTVSLRGGCNGFDVKKRKRTRERQTDRPIKKKCLKISKTHGCFRERPTWTQKPWFSRSFRFLLSTYFHPFISRFFYLSPRQGEEGTPAW